MGWKPVPRLGPPFDVAANELEVSSVHLPPQRSPKLLEVLGQALS